MFLSHSIEMVKNIDGLKSDNLCVPHALKRVAFSMRLLILDRSGVKNGVNYVFPVYKHCILRGRVQGSGFKVPGSRFQVQGKRFQVQGSRSKVRVQDRGEQV